VMLNPEAAAKQARDAADRKALAGRRWPST
jgi:hypothetical protein